jgi:NADPH:quinone reductase-like Zn-dependent oxidoreductase
MKAYILNEAGGVENLQLVEIPKPTLKSGEVLVKVKAISINPVDVNARAYDGVLTWIFQNQRPVILGWDISGVIEEVNSSNSPFKIGDEVFGMVNFLGSGKAYAEYVAAPAEHLSLKPKGTSFNEAAGATLAALTALQAINAGKVKAGDKVLIHGASGGVGHYAVQIAKSLGATVVGTSSLQNKEFVLKIGADKHIDYATQKFEDAGNDFDFVLDTVQGETLTRSIHIVKKGGTIITIPSYNLAESDLQLAKDKGVNLNFVLVASNGNDMNNLSEMLASGKLKTHIQETFRFENLGKAHKRMEAGKVNGKVIVEL